MKAFGDSTPFLGGDETIEWSKAIIFLQSDRQFPRIQYNNKFCLIEYSPGQACLLNREEI